MKTVIMRDIIELVGTDYQLDHLADTLTPSQFYDLMMNNGTEGYEKGIAVLTKGHPGIKEYHKALVDCLGKPRQFWDNANTLVGNINASITRDERLKFHITNRVIDKKLIDLLDKGVPENSEALNLVTEEVYQANNVLSGFLNEVYDDNKSAEVKLMLEGKPVRAIIGTQCEFFCARYQPRHALIIHLLKRFLDEDRKTLTLTKREILTCCERERYSGVIELHIMQSAFFVVFGKDKNPRSMCYPYFSEVSAVRKEACEGYPFKFPEEITVTINDQTWALLTSVPCEYIEK